MQIIEISEPGEDQGNDQEIAVGIDFGTTNSLVAISIEGQAKIILSPDHVELIPSIARFNDINIASIKRLLGRNKLEIENSPALFSLTKGLLDKNSQDVKLNINGKLLSPVQIAAKIFTILKDNASRYLSQNIQKVVVTVPAYFDDAAKGSVLLAAKLADLKVLRLIAEPTAAAYAYGINKKISGSYLVYDIGGGTFDVSVLNITRGVIEVLALGGDNLLGGDDIDLLLKNFLQEKYQPTISGDKLLNIAKEIKERLSYKNDISDPFEITREHFESLIFPLLQRTINIASEVLSEAEGVVIEGIILVGGSSRIPIIKKLLQQNFNTKILADIDPDKIVALGAALQAENLSNNNSALLIDAVPLSIGIELYGGLVEKKILRNSALPIAITEQYTTQVDNQSAIIFHIVQGEREFAKDCKSIGYFELNDLPASKAGNVKIEVTFALDVDGILSVTAQDLTTGKSHIIQIKPTYGLNQQEIDNILADSYKNATMDHQNMLLQEKIIAAQSFAENIENTLKIMKDIIELDQQSKINTAITLLKNAITIKDLGLINQNAEDLKKISNELMNRPLQNQITTILKGKNIGEF